ncbi:MAG: AI-2E family transporter, partial [Gemmatimonadota bacterium]
HGFAAAIHRRTPVPRTVAVLLTFALMLGALGAAAWWFGPRMGDEFGQLIERLPEITRDLTERLESTTWGAALLAQLGQPADALPDGGQAIGGITRLFSTMTGVLTSTVVILFIAIYLAVDPSLYRRALVRLAPAGRARSHLSDVLAEIARSLQLWMKARLLSMAVVGVLTGVALSIAGIPLAFALALIAAVLAFIPFIGPILASVPAILIGLGESGQAALIVGAIYLGVQTLESYLITPLIEKRVISLPPAFVLAAQLVMGTLFGLIGVFLATPIAVIVVVLVRRLYLEDVLEQDVEALGA